MLIRLRTTALFGIFIFSYFVLKRLLWGEFGYIVHVDTMDTGRYIKDSFKASLGFSTSRIYPDGNLVPDKMLIVPRSAREDASWIAEELPE
jgi:hypothetical protein